MDKFIVFQTLLTEARFYTVYDPIDNYENDELFTIVAENITIEEAEKLIKE